jgi:hypothetical protein
MNTKSATSEFSIKSAIVVALSVLLSPSLYSQSLLSGLGVEVGGGHNQLFWSAPTQYFPPTVNTTIKSDRTDLSFTPTVRVNYRWEVAPAVEVIPFIGYNQFGGKQKQANGYQDQFWFSALEGGTFAMYTVDDFSFGAGIEANYHLKVTGRWLGSYFQTTSANESWEEDNVSDWFTKWSGDAGARVSYQYVHFSLSLEGWFGVTKLQAGMFSPATIEENHFRILLGYNL